MGETAAVSNGAAPSSAPNTNAASTSAPSSAPNTSAKPAPALAPGAPQPRGNGPGANPANPISDDGRADPAAPAKPRHPWKTKIDDREVEIDIHDGVAAYKRKVKVDGEEIEIGLDDAYKSFERVRSSMKRFDEASKMKREAEEGRKQLDAQVQRIEKALSNPKTGLAILKKALGEEVFYNALSEEIVARLEYEKLSPEQRQRRDRESQLEREVSERETALERRKRKIEEQENQVLEQESKEHEERFLREWPTHMKSAGVPVTRRTIAMMAEAMATAARAGVRISEAEAAQMVKDELRELVNGAVGGSDPEYLRSLLGDEGAAKLRQAEVARLQNQPGRTPLPPDAASSPPARAPRRSNEPFTMSTDEYRRKLREEDEKRSRRR